MRGTFRYQLASLTTLLIASFGITAHPAGAAEFGKYAVESVSASLSTTQAGAHADMTSSFALTTNGSKPYALTRDLRIALPPGVIGNPQGIPRCTTLQLGRSPAESECPVDSQVGTTQITVGGITAGTFDEPIYNMVPPGGDVVARLGFFASVFPTIIDVKVNPIDYNIEADVDGVAGAAGLIAATTTLWGVPAAPVHDPLRITPEEAQNGGGPPGGRASGLPEVPFMTNPTDCSTVRRLSITATSYQEPGAPSSLSAPFPQITGCGKVTFAPRLTLTPTNPEAAAPTGIDATLEIPQNETPQGLGTSNLKTASVTLPPGLTINPAAGDGLAACSPTEVRFETPEESHCPAAAKIGTAEIDVPALERVLQGSVYQRTPEPGNLFRFWLVTDELGVHLKLPAEIIADPVSGRLTTVFNGIASLGGNPQVPIAALRLHIFGGPRAPLSTPASCGTYQTHYEFTPWSGGATSVGETPMQIVGGCNKGGFSPAFSAGTTDPFAGHHTDFVLDLTRQDGEANLTSLQVRMPAGLLATLAGVPLCADTQASSGNCDPSTEIGAVDIAAGVGGAPLWLPQAGKEPTAIYLAGPYHGAPYSLVVKVPAEAGPFDLGTVVTRAAIEIDPTSARVSVVSDPLPQILEGVPVAYRDIHVTIDRPNFILNPTNCGPQAIFAGIHSSTGATAEPRSGFQATNCATLGFKPHLSLSLSGAKKRAGNPALRAELTYPNGDQANISKVQVVLPKSEFIDNRHVNNPCTRPQFAAGTCPAKSILGRARVVTPLLGQPLEGPVYFRSNGGERKLPDVVADLRGPVHIILVGFIDSVRKKGSETSRVRTTFASVPDAPVSKVILNMFGGKKGLLQNNTNLCRGAHKASVLMVGQNARRQESEPTVHVACREK
jgi:hypothetical protein